MNVTIVASYTAFADEPPAYLQELTIPDVVTQEGDWLLAWYTYAYDGAEAIPFVRDLVYGAEIISFANTAAMNDVTGRTAVYVRKLSAAQAGTHDLTALEFLPNGNPSNATYKTLHAIVVRNATDQVENRAGEVLSPDAGTNTYDIPADTAAQPFTDWFMLVATDTLGTAPSPALAVDGNWTPIASVVLPSNHLQTKLLSRTDTPYVVPATTVTLESTYTFAYLYTGLFTSGPSITGTTTYTYGGTGVRLVNREDIRNMDELQNALRATYRTRRRGEG